MKRIALVFFTFTAFIVLAACSTAQAAGRDKGVTPTPTIASAISAPTSTAPSIAVPTPVAPPVSVPAVTVVPSITPEKVVEGSATEPKAKPIGQKPDEWYKQNQPYSRMYFLYFEYVQQDIGQKVSMAKQNAEGLRSQYGQSSNPRDKKRAEDATANFEDLRVVCKTVVEEYNNLSEASEEIAPGLPEKIELPEACR